MKPVPEAATIGKKRPVEHHDLELVSHHLCPYVQRAVIALKEKGVAHERRYIDLADKPAWFTAISPLGKVPLLWVKAPDGRESALFESAVICEYLEDTRANPLHPADPLERARHRAWIEFASAVLDDIASLYNARDGRDFDAKLARLAHDFAWLDRNLGAGPYFAGGRFSLVDAAFGPVFRYFDTFDRVDDFGVFDVTPRVSAYRASLAERPSVKTAVGADYPARLAEFLLQRGSHVSTVMRADAA